jgi:hypothetical protein
VLAQRRKGNPYRPGRVVALALVALPLLPVPIYLVGSATARTLDTDPTNGVLALGLVLGVGLPAVTSLALARSWGQLGWLPTTLGVASGVASVGVLFVAFAAYCSTVTCSEVPPWYLGAAYGVLAGVGITVGVAVRWLLRRRR